MASSVEQQLLYSLRSPTTPLNDKLELASTALSNSTASTSLAPLIRDWILDTLFKLVRSSSTSTTTEQALSNPRLWELLSSTTELTPTASTTTLTLPIYVVFIQIYAKGATRDGQVLRDATRVWSKLGPNAIRKATVDAVSDGYEKLVNTSLELLKTETEETSKRDWQELGVVWLKAVKSVFVEAAKGGKKVPAHTLSLLPSLVPLLDQLAPASSLHSALLETIRISLFNLDNLRRGLARDSYASGGAVSVSATTTTADSELLASLSTLPSTLYSSIYAVLPSLTHVYLSSLSTNSANLFPLPAKATFPTPSAQKSALEVLGLGKRRELAGRWVKGVVDLIGWTATAANGTETETEKARALARVLVEVEKGDLYRPGQGGEVWNGVLPSIATGAVDRLEGIPSTDASRRDATIEVLSSVHRLEYEVLDRELPKVLAVLARTPASNDTDSATPIFLSLLLTHHSRSLTMPTLLSRLSDALASSPFTSPNNLLTTFSFNSQLGRSISGMLASSTSIRATWENLLNPILSALSPAQPSTHTSMSVDQEGTPAVSTEVPSPAKKRKLSSSTTTPDSPSLLSSAARVRILTKFISSLPTSALSSLVEVFETFVEEIVDSNLKDFTKFAAASSGPRSEAEATPSKKVKKTKRKSLGEGGGGGDDIGNEKPEPIVVLGIELLEARYAILTRLCASGLLPLSIDKEEGKGNWAEVKSKRREGLRDVVEKGSNEAVVVSARILLQQLELATSPLDDASSILRAVLSRLVSKTEASWSGNLRGLQREQISVALWEMISRRFMIVFESFATEDQLKDLVAVVVESLATEESASRDSITRRLLKRADFWEMHSLQGQLRPALLNLVSLPSLPAPSVLLPLLSASSPSKSLSSIESISTSTLLSTSRTFSRLSSFVPLDYLGREYRSQLAERALSLDLWVSTAAVDVQAAEKEAAQIELREFVGYMGSVVDEAPQVLARLVRQTLPGAKVATLSLYRSLIQTSLATFSDSKSPAELLAFLKAFGDKPLSDVSKRAKKDATLSDGLTCEESAYVLLLDLLATTLGEVASVNAELAATVRSSFKAASKPFGKALSAVTAARTTMDAFRLGDLLEATRSVWTTKDWLAGDAGASDDEQDTIYASFTQTALSVTISQLPTSVSKPSALSVCLSLLDLLSHRIKRLRTVSSGDKVNTQPFETLIATHLFFRQSFGIADCAAFDSNLIRATAAATLDEYTVAVEGISSTISSIVSVTDLSATALSLQASLSMSMILLRDGPEGSVKLSSAAFSELLRHLCLLVETVGAKSEQDEQVAKTYLVVATFLDGVCADRPMLLSRLNVSSVLSLVSRILQPSPAHDATSTSIAATSETASALLRTLASTVGHVVRHRKDHVVPLFPQLVSTLTAFLSILRRAGFGSTGSTASVEDADAGIVLGQRAEREARATFPPWAWQGGAKGINKGEAAAVGRLLGSLTTKTTSMQHKNHKKATDEANPTSSGMTTTSLSAPLSKHAPFLLLAYLRACVHPTCPIPSALRGELQGGWFEVMDSMGKWEREALMKGFLSEDEEAERGVLRGLWKSWEKERYRG